MMHQQDRAAALQNAASRSSPALRRRGSSHNGPMGTSPKNEAQLSRARPMPSHMSHPDLNNIPPSPRTNRRSMLSAELTGSLRKHMLWERQSRTKAISNKNRVRSEAGLFEQANRPHISEDVKKLRRNETTTDFYDNGNMEYYIKGWWRHFYYSLITYSIIGWRHHQQRRICTILVERAAFIIIINIIVVVIARLALYGRSHRCGIFCFRFQWYHMFFVLSFTSLRFSPFFRIAWFWSTTLLTLPLRQSTRHFNVSWVVFLIQSRPARWGSEDATYRRFRGMMTRFSVSIIYSLMCHCSWDWISYIHVIYQAFFVLYVSGGIGLPAGTAGSWVMAMVYTHERQTVTTIVVYHLLVMMRELWFFSPRKVYLRTGFVPGLWLHDCDYG